jgi:rhodanese-related sulfurtransferase
MKATHFLTIAAVVSSLFIAGCDGPAAPEAELEAMTRKVAKKFQEVPQLSTADLAAWMADSERKPPQLLDARTPAEFAVSHLPGAIRVDPGASAEKAIAKIDPARRVVIYCSVGYRSSELARRLIKAGQSNTMNLEGSIFKWANESRPLTREGKPTRSVHPYNANYGRMLRKEFRSYH